MGVLGALLAGVLVAVAVAEPAPPPHTLLEVLTCQPDPPSLSLSLILDSRALFWFDFPGSRWLRGGPDLPPRPGALEPPGEILPETQICREILGKVSAKAARRLPQAKAIPSVSVFPLEPPSPGEPTTLVCLVENIFPPALDISWTVAGAAVTSGVTLGPFLPAADLTFVRFSRISVRPTSGATHACVVTSGRDNATAVAYWVAPEAALDEQLDTALAGAALALGLVLALLGAGLALLARDG